MSQFFQTSDGLSLAFEDAGAGPPVVCLPGLTRNARDFDDLASELGGEVRMIRVTYRGRGASDRDPNPANYALPVEARDVIELLDHLGLERVIFVGTSRGGLIAMLLAATAKTRIAGVVLNDIGPVLDPKGLALIADYIGVAPKGKTLGDVAASLQGLFGEAFPDVPLARWEQCAGRWFEETPTGVDLAYDPRLRDGVLAALTAPSADLWPLFDGLDGVPVAVIRGQNSDLLSADTVAGMARRRPDLIQTEIPDRGHVPFLDEPGALAAIRTLISKVEI